MFTLYRDKFRIHQAVGHKLGEFLNDGSLGSYGIGGYHIGINLSHGDGYRCGTRLC
jgi:hypothetical protein